MLLAGRALGAGVTIEANPGGYTTTSSADGSFALTLPSNTYTVSAARAGYLPVQRSNVQAPAGGAVTLAGAELTAGDINGDQVIDTADVALVVECFGRAASCKPAADINGDGLVNIQDLVLVAGNTDKHGPQPW